MDPANISIKTERTISEAPAKKKRPLQALRVTATSSAKTFLANQVET